MKKKIDVDFQRIPLQDAFAFIGEEIKATIEIDGDALKAGGFTKNMPQTFKKQQITALEAIAMILQKYQTTHKPEQSMVIVVDEDKKKIIVSTEGACKVKKLTPYKVFKKE